MESLESKPEILSGYEKEKIEATLKQVQALERLISSYLGMIDYCTKKGWNVIKTPSFLDLRTLDGIAGPKSDLVAISLLFEKAMTQMASGLTKSQYTEAVDAQEKIDF